MWLLWWQCHSWPHAGKPHSSVGCAGWVQSNLLTSEILLELRGEAEECEQPLSWDRWDTGDSGAEQASTHQNVELDCRVCTQHLCCSVISVFVWLVSLSKMRQASPQTLSLFHTLQQSMRFSLITSPVWTRCFQWMANRQNITKKGFCKAVSTELEF